MQRRILVVSRAVAVLIGGLAAVASASPPAGYRCGKNGKPAAASEGCTCPAGKRSSRNGDDVAVCVAARAAVRAPVPTVILPPPPPEPTCPSDMVPVHGGSFDMGTPVGGGGDPDEIPVPTGKRTVRLSAFCIDRTEVTVEAYADCVAAGACTPAPDTVEWTGIADVDRTLWNDAKLCNANRDDRQSHPVNCVTWDQASTYCTAQQRRLPSEAEWEYAARGSDGRQYPWPAALGAPSPTLFNGCDRACAALGKMLGLTWKPLFAASDDFAGTAPVGSYPDGASAFGGLDARPELFKQRHRDLVVAWGIVHFMIHLCPLGINHRAPNRFHTCDHRRLWRKARQHIIRQMIEVVIALHGAPFIACPGQRFRVADVVGMANQNRPGQCLQR